MTPCITSHVVDGDVIILHKDQNSLLKFTPVSAVTESEVSEAVDKAMGNLDWNQDFEIVFSKEKYRMAVMQVPNLLMS